MCIYRGLVIRPIVSVKNQSRIFESKIAIHLKVICFWFVLYSHRNAVIIFPFWPDSHSFRHFSVHLSMFYVIVMSLTKATSYSDIFSIEPMLRFFCLPCIHKYNIWSIPTKKHGENAKRYSKQQTQSTWRIWTLVVAFVKGITVVLSIREHLHSWRIPACTTKFSLTAGSTLGSRYTPPWARSLGKCRTPTVASVNPSCQDRGK